MSYNTVPRVREGVMPVNRTKRRILSCRHCQKNFVQQTIGQKVCGVECAVAFARKSRVADYQKQVKAQNRKQREALKTVSDLKKEAQAAFNRYIRVRDEHKPCISCGQSPHKGQRHAGHYRTRAAAPQLAFNTFNVHAQCAQCNNSKSGNIVEYRKELVNRIGHANVLKLEHDNRKSSCGKDELRRIKKLFSARARHLSRLRQSMAARRAHRSDY